MKVEIEDMAITDRRRLRASDADVRALLDAITDHGIFLLDRDGRISNWSAGAEAITGYREDEVLGRHFSIFYAPDAVASGKPQRALELASASGRYEEEGWRLRKDGSRFMADVVITPAWDGNGRLIGFAKVTRDVTPRMLERKRAVIEEREQIAAEIYKSTISVLLEVGIEMQALAVRTDADEVRDRLEAAVAQLDVAIRELRALIFHLGADRSDGRAADAAGA